MQPKLFMVLLGCRPKGRNTEQHDVYFGIGETLSDLVPGIKQSWPGAGEIHIDAWREVATAGSYSVTVIEKTNAKSEGMDDQQHLFFINLGGYRQNEFDEFHYKLLTVADSLETAKAIAKKTAFYKHTGLVNSASAKNAVAHIDDKFGIDVDDASIVKDLLSPELKAKYAIQLLKHDAPIEDDIIHLGYLRLSAI